MNVLGIDIGIHGGIALLDGEDALVMDMPTHDVEINGKTKRRIHVGALADYVSGLCMKFPIAFVEKAQASPRMGVSSAFAYGECFGVVVGILAKLGVTVRLVVPVKWKRDMGLVKPGAKNFEHPKDVGKDKAIDLARKLYPQLHRELNLAKHDGRAEALLIAHWGAEQLEQEAAGPLFGHEVADVRKRATAEVEF